MSIIVTDLDGTLLRTDKTISPYTVEVLEKCRKNGIKVVFATARSAQAAARITALFKPDAFIGYGGALITDKQGKVISRACISAAVSRRLIKEFLSTSQIYSIYAINESTALTNNLDFIDSVGDYSHYKLCSFKEEMNMEFLKLSVDSTDKAVVEEIGTKYPMCDLLHYSGENLSRFASREAVKWNGIKKLAAYFSVRADDFIAFGDDTNDLEMLENCGMGIAVDNATAQVKAAAKNKCESNDNDGVAKWIEKELLLNREDVNNA